MKMMNEIDTVNNTRKLRLLFTLGCVLFSIFIHCWGLRKDDTDQLMALMMKQLQILRPEDRNSFIDLCVSKGEECAEHQVSGSNALFSYRVGADDKSKIRFWETYKCVYKKKLLECPVDGGWTEWAQWTSCKADCEDRGWQSRARYCENPKPSKGGERCDGLGSTNRSCIGPCKGNANGLDEAKEYITQTHSVFPELEGLCIEKHCYYVDVLKAIRDKSKVDKYWSSIICVKYSGPCPVNGGWGTWESWSGCSVECGNGEVFRKRDCNNPTTKNGGMFCIGPFYDTKRCLKKNCNGYGEFTDWSDWSSCSESCGVYGTKTSTRSCLRKQPCYFDGARKTEIVKSMPCYGGECPRTGGWSAWGAWTICSARCGTGRKVRMRRCNEPPPSSGGDCAGPALSVQSCDGSYCVQIPEASDLNLEARSKLTKATIKRKRWSGKDDVTETMKRRRRAQLPKIDEDDPFNLPLDPDLESLYTEWSDWTQCTKSCGGGRRQRKRGCKNKKTVCKGEVMPVQFCNPDPCPVAGGWGSWMGWSVCSVTCGFGQYERYRPCNNPLPSFGGSCSGVNSEFEPCKRPKCNSYISSLFGPWTLWTACTTTCGGGTRTRHRYLFGLFKTTEAKICNAVPCSENGMWAAWGGWSQCSLPCGLGMAFRDRTCTDPAPVYGGEPCDGQGSEIQTCFGGPCFDEDDHGVEFRGAGYVQYAEHGSATSFLMIFMRVKLIQERGTLFHHTDHCGGSGVTDCDLSIQLGMAGRSVHLAIKTPTLKEPVKITSTTEVEMDKWLDIFVIVTVSWAGMRLNDEGQIVHKFPVRLKEGLNFDGVLMVGANRLKQDGFHGTIAVLRKNFKVLVLFNMKSWSGYGAPTDSSNVDKIQLPLEARHPDFRGKFYSHIYFRKSTYLQVLIIFSLTGFNGLLLFNAGMATNSSVAVTVKNGALEFCLNCGYKPLCRKAYELKAGEWYLLKVSATGNEGQMRMNDGDAMQIMCPAGDRYVPRSSVYVGGAGQLDWAVINEVTKTNMFFQGMIDSLVVNDKTVTYKMASLIDGEGWTNTLGYSLADHVSQVFENEKATTTLRCGLPERTSHSQLIRMIWLQDMKRIVSSPGTEISNSDSINQTVSSITLHSSHHYEGVYSCLLSTDGILVNLHVFVLMRIQPEDDSDLEALAEWIIFIILMALILLVICPLIIYFCTKDHSFWEKFKSQETTEAKPLITSDTTDTESGVSSGSSLTASPATSPSPSSSSVESLKAETAVQTPVAAPADDKAVPAGEPSPGAGILHMPCETQPTTGGSRKLNFIEQITIKMPPHTFHPCLDPNIEGVDNDLFSDQTATYPCRPPCQGWDPCSTQGMNQPCQAYPPPCPPYPQPCQPNPQPCQPNPQPCPPISQPNFIPHDVYNLHAGPDTIQNVDFLPPCQGWDPCSTQGMIQPCQPNPQPCPPISRPNFIPRDVYNLHAGPDPIKSIDFLRNPYYLAGTFNPCNFNQNNPSTDNKTNNAASGFSDSNTDNLSAGVTKDSSQTNRKGSGINICQESICSEDRENYRCKKQLNETITGCRTEALIYFDESFTVHNGPKSFESNVCNLEMSDMSVGRQSNFLKKRKVNSQDRKQSAEIGEDSFTVVDNDCNRYSGGSNTDISHPTHCKQVKHWQNLQKYGHKRNEQKVDLQKQPKGSFCKGKLENSTSSVEQQCCQAVGTCSDKHKVAVESEYTCDTDSNVTIVASNVYELTSKIASGMKGQHKRTKSLSKLPDTSHSTS